MYPIQMQLPPNPNEFSIFFLHFRNLHNILNSLDKKNDAQRLFVSETIYWKNSGYFND